MYDEEELLPISALQHLVFCERQCALIHVEQVWVDNILTAEGRNLHERVDQAGTETRRDILTSFGVRLRSLRLGLSGRADVVQFLRCDSEEGGVVLPGTQGHWIPFPVEHKRGRPKPNRCDEVQLCAQALCLEEMLGTTVPRGALYYWTPRRRTPVEFDSELRAITEVAVPRLHELLRSGRTPPAVYETKCESCSLKGICLPKATSGKLSARKYLRKMVEACEETT